MKWESRLWWVACLLVGLLYVATVPRLWQCEGVDEIEYLGLASSLAAGHGYAINGLPHVLYPPLYPVILSLSIRDGMLPWEGMYQSNAIFGFGAIVVAATWLRRFGRPGLVASWLALLSYYSWSFSTRYLLSEPLAALMSAGLLLLTWSLLEENRARPATLLLAGLVAMLCAMTRFGSIALVGSIALAGIVRALGTKTRAGVLVCAVVLLAGGGFTLFWECRGAVIDPGAAESYGRWALRLVGLSHETTGIVASNLGEGTSGAANWPARILETGVRCGQFMASAVRMPGNFAPLGLLAAAMTLVGLAAHLRRVPWSPVGWYVLASLGLISLTSWVSSYLRYLYLLAPFLFYFFVTGADLWRRRLAGGDRLVCIVTSLWGVAGLWWTISHRSGFGRADAEQLYLAVVGMFCGLAYAWLLFSGLAGSLRKAAQPRAVPALAVILWMVLAGAHSAMIASLRFKETLGNATLCARNLEGAVQAGQWLNVNSPPDAVVATTMPKLMSFLANRRCAAADAAAGYAVAVGALRDVPGFRADEEERLARSLDKLCRQGEWERVDVSGDAAVFRRANGR